MSSRSPEVARIKNVIEAFSGILSFFSILMIGAYVLTLPFPLVRRLWLKEFWGYYGLWNSICFFWIAERVKKHEIPPIFVGWGILLYDQFLMWRGFLILARQELTSGDIIFAITSFFVSVGLFFLLLVLFRKETAYQAIKLATISSEDAKKDVASEKLIGFLSLCGYGIAFFVFSRFSSLEPTTAFPLIRITSAIGCSGIFFMIGREVERWAKQESRKKQELIAGLAMHGIGLVTLLWFVYARLPIAQALQLS